MRFRDSLVVLLPVVLAALLMAALPGGSVVAPGSSAGDPCLLPQTRFSTQVCNIPSPLASVSDEFNSTDSANNWTVVAQRQGVTASNALDLYVTPSPNNLYSFSGYRAGWFFTQPIPDAGAEFVGMYRDYSAPAVLTAYLQFSSLMVNQSGSTVAVFLSTSSTTVPNVLVGAGCRVRLTSNGANSVDAYTDTGSSGSMVVAGNLGRTDVLVLHRNDTDFRCWMGTDDGRFVYGATVTKTVTVTRIWLVFTSSATTNSWAGLTGVNYLRVYEGARVLP